MKQSVIFSIFFASSVFCFPRGQLQERATQLIHTKQLADMGSADETNCGPTPCVIFDIDEQNGGFTMGVHKYIAPKPGSQRGPCPGLNAAANHGHIPRSGRVTIDQAVTGLVELFGMGADLAGLSAAYAVALIGDVATKTFSIGGPITVHGRPTKGLASTHNIFEGDSSPISSDSYLTGGDVHSVNLTKFQHLYDMGVYNEFNGIPQYNWNYSMIRQHFKYSQEESIANNPHYFSAPFSGLTVVPHTYPFLIGLLSSHTALRPNGYVDQSNLKNLYGISGETRPFNGKDPIPFVVVPGGEHFKNKWNRRPSSVPYGIAESIADVIIGFREEPSTLRLGGNTGTTDSFEAVSISDFTSGLYTDDTVLDGNNFACFSLQSMLAGLPDNGQDSPARELVNSYIQPHLDDLGCPSVDTPFDMTLFEKFPGYNDNH